MDIIVNASGKIVASGRTKSIASIEMARVDRLYIQEGQVVHKGDPLIDLDTRIIENEQAKAMSDKVTAQLQIARSRALLASINAKKLQPLRGLDDLFAERVDDARFHLNSQWHEYEVKLKRFDDEIERYSNLMPYYRQLVDDYKLLSDKRDVSVHSYIQKVQDLAENESKLTDVLNQRKALMAETKKNAQDALNEALRVMGQADADVKRSGVHSELLKLKAPVDGTVQQLAVHTLGGIVQPAQTLMLIVPKDDPVEIEAFVENKDIGFIKEGQSANIKIETFDYTKYGFITGAVVKVSKDAIDPNNISAMESMQNKDKPKRDQDNPKGALYSVKISLNKKSMEIDGSTVHLTPGMSAGIEIKTGSRRIIEYFLSPLIKGVRESMNER